MELNDFDLLTAVSPAGSELYHSCIIFTVGRVWCKMSMLGNLESLDVLGDGVQNLLCKIRQIVAEGEDAQHVLALRPVIRAVSLI